MSLKKWFRYPAWGVTWLHLHRLSKHCCCVAFFLAYLLLLVRLCRLISGIKLCVFYVVLVLMVCTWGVEIFINFLYYLLTNDSQNGSCVFLICSGGVVTLFWGCTRPLQYNSYNFLLSEIYSKMTIDDYIKWTIVWLVLFIFFFKVACSFTITSSVNTTKLV